MSDKREAEGMAPGEAGGEERTALEQRIDALVESEREARERLEQRRAERQAAEKAEAERQLAAMEEALAEARVEAEERDQQQLKTELQLSDMEEALAEARAEIDSLATRLGQAERDLGEARRTMKPRAARRIAAAEEALAEARAELEQERAQRAELEQRVEVLVALEAEAQQALVRERAERSRERERLLAIEQQVQALVESEQPRHGGTSPPAREPVPPVLETLRRRQRPAEEAVKTVQPADVTEESNDASHDRREGPRRSRFRRRRRRQARGHTCVVCKRTVAKSPDQLEAGGWELGREADLCPDCQEQGWQLPEDGGLPFRRSSDRDVVS